MSHMHKYVFTFKHDAYKRKKKTIPNPRTGKGEGNNALNFETQI